MARALATSLKPGRLTVVVNIGDDDDVYGLRVCADLDTVVYTLAGLEGADGWGIAGDTFNAMDQMDRLGVDTSFRLGDRDLALCALRTSRLRRGEPLSSITQDLAVRLGVSHRILPVSDDQLRTRLLTTDDEWLDFQEYFVVRRHADEIAEVQFDGADTARPAPGVVDAIDHADIVVLAPSNPVLSMWPLLSVAEVRAAVQRHQRVSAVSPLFGGKTVKGPAAELLESAGLGSGNAAVVAAYPALLTHLVVDERDTDDVGSLASSTLDVDAMPTLLTDPIAAAAFAEQYLNYVLVSPPRSAS